jgi:hypothetical protein
MKTKTLIMFLSLWSCLSFSQMAWDFTNWSGDTWNDLAEDTLNWTPYFLIEEGQPPLFKGHYNANGLIFDQTKANGNDIVELQGLSFDYLFSDVISKHVFIDLAYAPSRLKLDGNGVILNIHNCIGYDTLTMVMEYLDWKNSGDAIGVNLIPFTNGEYKETSVESFLVETTGTAGLYLKGEGALNIFSIHSGMPTDADYELVNFINEVKNGDTTWYEPGDTTWYEPGDTTWYEPGDTTWHEPGDTTWYEPGDTTWHEPGDTTWYEPGDTTWYEPGDTTWHEPGDPENAWDKAQIKLWYPDRKVDNTEVFSILLHTSMLDPTLGIIAYQFDLHYDNNAMEYQGYDIENSISAGGSIVVNANDTGVLHVSWMKQDTLTGTGLLVKLDFKALSPGYAYCQISDFLFNTNPIYDIENGDIEIMELIYGDVDGNYQVQAYDAAIVLQHSVGLDPLPAVDPLPWDNWRLLRADVDEAEGITANDAAFILQYSAKLINTFPVESLMRSAQSNGASISITQEDNQLVFRSYGDMIGLNIQAFGDLSVLGVPEIMDKNMISATNINGDVYSVGLARAYASEDGETFMIIPLISDDYAEISFDAIVNTETQSYFNQVGTGLSSRTETEEITCINNGRQLLLYNLPTKSQISIYSITGQLMSSNTSQSTSINLDIQILNRGIYLIRIENQGQTQTFKFIRN